MQRSSHLVSIYVIGQRDCRGGKGFSPSTFFLPHTRTHTHTHTHTHAQDVYRHANTYIFTVMAIVATISNYSIGKKFSDFVITTNT